MRDTSSIPHGIEEMVLDEYLQAAGWDVLRPHIHFSLHRSLLMPTDDVCQVC